MEPIDCFFHRTEKKGGGSRGADCAARETSEAKALRSA